MTNILTGIEKESVVHTAPQVYWATHDSQGNIFPDYQRSFISFSYGGKHIEDFDLIAYCNGSTMERAGSAEFEDLTSSYDILDGETYHGTHFKPFQLSLSLATDGITQKQLEKFKSWFRGGVTRRLILAEHSNRMIYARVQSPPQLHLIPFEMPFTMQIGVDEYEQPITYQTVSTLYKGTIDITFISSDPFWIAINHLAGRWTENGEFDTSNWNGINWKENSDYKKLIAKLTYEDNMPLGNMALGDTRMAFGQTGVEMTLGASSKVSTPTDTKSRGLVTRDATLSSQKLSQIITIEKKHRPIALPSGSIEFARFDNVIAWADPESNGDPSVTGEFKWWEPWNWNDTFDSSLTGEDFINQYPDREYVNYRGARILPDNADELIIETYSITGGISGSNIVDAYKYPQVLGEDLEDDDEDEEINLNTRGITRSSTKGTKKSPEPYYFFYGGTAPSPATISFKLPLKFTSNGLKPLYGNVKDKRYIKSIASSLHKINGETFSTLTIDGVYTKKVSMTTPNIMTSYNTVIKIIKDSSGKNVIDLQEKIRDEIRHPYVRAYALAALQALINYENSDGGYNGHYDVIPADHGSGDNPAADSGEPHRRVWANMMSTFWVNNDSDKLIEIIIDSKTSKATGTFQFRKNPLFSVQKFADSYQLDFNNDNANDIVSRIEDIGDAMRTTWYYIDDRNEYKEKQDASGNLIGYEVAHWDGDNDDLSEEEREKTKSYSHRVTSNFPVALKNFSIDYEYMYL